MRYGSQPGSTVVEGGYALRLRTENMFGAVVSCDTNELTAFIGKRLIGRKAEAC